MKSVAFLSGVALAGSKVVAEPIVAFDGLYGPAPYTAAIGGVYPEMYPNYSNYLRGGYSGKAWKRGYGFAPAAVAAAPIAVAAAPVFPPMVEVARPLELTARPAIEIARPLEFATRPYDWTGRRTLELAPARFDLDYPPARAALDFATFARRLGEDEEAAVEPAVAVETATAEEPTAEKRQLTALEVDQGYKGYAGYGGYAGGYGGYGPGFGYGGLVGYPRPYPLPYPAPGIGLGGWW
ncbi:hypothetical protein GNI_162840 [Gregarina niphandrodes]|uniref:Transmembrane protein n=1 Tax=Gregarina niphandrodes TaxID=110365 RepID=A0A023AYD6_GRENI|nr:hypothetical protein GNI_162840 [Gregarina niphandrodes]EZG43671.1 hypothetical protein GNI_162840 [Gregarina niphandrodes]|eukprot:XP_011133097.1 hypothetical protein GNI_162840 [Gregarina niphandrodes]